MSHKAYLEIRRVDYNGPQLFLNKMHFTWMRIPLRSCILMLIYGGKVITPKRYLRGGYRILTQNLASLHLLLATARQSSYPIEQRTQDIPYSGVDISHTLYCLFYVLATCMFYMFGDTSTSQITTSGMSTTLDLGDEDSTTCYVTCICRQSPQYRAWSRTEHHNRVAICTFDKYL